MEGSVSVIIPCYNDSGVLPRALDSVIKQTLPPDEILIVDDGSHRNEASKIQAICNNYESARYIRRDRTGGAGLARNSGIDQSIGDYLSFLDVDDEMYPDKLEQQLNALKACRAEAVLSDHHQSRDGELLPQEITYEYFLPSGNRLTMEFGLRCGIQLVGILLKREVVTCAGGFRTMPNGQDKDFFLRSLIRGADWLYLAMFAGVRHGRSSSLSADEYTVLKRNQCRNVLLLTAHELHKRGLLQDKKAEILAEKIAIEARRWADYEDWNMARHRWKQALAVHPRPELHGTSIYKLLTKSIGFIPTEKIRKVLGK